MTRRFEWDEAKNRANVARHGISFQRACGIFEGPTVTRTDDSKDYAETRLVSIGVIEEALVLTVVHTERKGVTRIISARRASRLERRVHEEAIRQGTHD